VHVLHVGDGDVFRKGSIMKEEPKMTEKERMAFIVIFCAVLTSIFFGMATKNVLVSDGVMLACMFIMWLFDMYFGKR
jgi:hypothetical protein